jgi:AraC-like DNA-binding protein/ligand-binding sensor protein
MKPVAFEDVARLPIVQFYETAFRKATGVTLKVVAPEGACGLPFGPAGNPFCNLVSSSPAGCGSCLETENRARRNAARKLITQQLHCYAGLTVVAAPVIVGGLHVATLLSGQVFRREPTERDFLIIAKMLEGGQGYEWLRKAHQAYFDTPVLTADRFQAVVQLLEVFSQYLADFAGRQAMAANDADPEPVAGAKEFIQTHAEEPITLDQVVEHVHVSRFHFCKLFKKATGMTLTEYVLRVRIEKAKTLLIDPSLRISEVVFAAGFGSIPRFNSVFKRHVGMAPSEYRAAMRTQLLV